ncbi:MAG: hypothetical protein Q8941_20965 [Bacteroidota bacterium]|nr:hypothetical protein [Bacteroidota bacterium]
MKKTILIVTLLLSGFVFESATAQVRVSLRANIGIQPGWGPVGYDHVDYYYMPDIDAFYYVPSHQYIYQERGRWIFATSLPYRFHDYDVNNSYKVVVNDSRPYRHAETYRTKYAGYRGNHDQGTIRNSRDSKYFESKDHPDHDKWKRDHNHGRNDHNHGG